MGCDQYTADITIVIVTWMCSNIICFVTVPHQEHRDGAVGLKTFFLNLKLNQFSSFLFFLCFLLHAMIHVMPYRMPECHSGYSNSLSRRN